MKVLRKPREWGGPPPGNLRLRCASPRKRSAFLTESLGPSKAVRPTPVTQPLCQALFQHCLRGLGTAEGPCRLGSSLSFTTNMRPASPPTPDFKHRITVQASPGLDRRRNVFEVGAGDSPTFPRFRAIQCKKLRLPLPMPLPPDLILLSVKPYPWK